MAVNMEPGTTVGGRYRLLSVLGTGGMGTVFVAETTAGERVALKTLNPQFSESPEIRSRFEREAQATGFLNHPHVVSVGELGSTEDGTLYLVMELVTGESVARILVRGAIHPRRALILLRQTLLGLGHAHQHGLIHRDLKPDNLMVTSIGEPGREYDHVRILDFGLVKILADVAQMFGSETLTRTGAVFGTPEYMAPEQALGRRVDLRADLYALGVVLYEMLMGAPPFQSDDPIQLLRMQVSMPPPELPDTPWATPELRSILARSMAKDADARFSSASEMITAVDEAFLSLNHVANPAG